MKIDLTLPKESLPNDIENSELFQQGHLGTHLDVMDKQFSFTQEKFNGIIFDVHSIRDRDIDIDDISLSMIQENDFVLFFTNFINEHPYGSEPYRHEHPQLSPSLIDALLEKHISFIGLDCAGMRRGKEHSLYDQHCANQNIFVIENLCHLEKLIQKTSDNRCTIYISPISTTGKSGIPCKVEAE